MLSSGSVRRALAATAAAGMAAGLVALPNAAQAAVQTDFYAAVHADAHYTGSSSGVNCFNSGQESVTKQTTPQAFTAGTHHASESQSVTFTNTATPSDSVTVAGHVSATMTVVKSGVDLKSFKLSASGSMSVTHSLLTGSKCFGGGTAYGFGEMEFTEHSPGLLFLSRSIKKNAVGVVLILNVATGNPVAVDLGAVNSGMATGQAYLPKGTYALEEGVAGVDANGDINVGRDAGRNQSTAVSATVSATFVKGGSPVGAADGAATHYVMFPSSVKCSSGSATMQWTGAASKASSGVFLVNGKQKGSTQAPFAGQKVTVKVPSSSTAKITAKVKLKSGKTVTASRSYYACKG